MELRRYTSADRFADATQAFLLPTRHTTTCCWASYLWDDEGPVSMAARAGPTPNGVRISAVYTPPEKRRRGYASACVAALSQRVLDRGRRFCFLFTDLANPTSTRSTADRLRASV